MSQQSATKVLRHCAFSESLPPAPQISVGKQNSDPGENYNIVMGNEGRLEYHIKSITIMNLAMPYVCAISAIFVAVCR